MSLLLAICFINFSFSSEGFKIYATIPFLSIFVDRGMTQEAISELWNIEFDYNVKNEVWLKNFIGSDFVITDSFHGMCMAIIFEKQFIVINNSARGSKNSIYAK